MTSGVPGCIHSRSSTLVQLTSFSVVQESRNDKLDNTLKQEITKLVNDLNHETAQYSTLVVALGGSQDTVDLRNELKYIRKRAFDIARQNKQKLIPALRRKTICEEDCKQLERLFNMYSSCLELLETELFKTLMLQKMFPLQSGMHFLINVGTYEPFMGFKSQMNISDVSIHKETEDLNLLERDIADVKELLFTINQKIAVQPWAADCYNENSQQNEDCKSDISSNGSSASSIDITMVEPDNKRRRWLCVILMIFVAVLLSATIIGVCLGLLK